MCTPTASLKRRLQQRQAALRTTLEKLGFDNYAESNGLVKIFTGRMTADCEYEALSALEELGWTVLVLPAECRPACDSTPEARLPEGGAAHAAK